MKKVCLEPGRYIVCDSTILLSKINDVKDAGPKRYVGIDAGFNVLIRPSFYDSYHHVALANKFNKACVAKYEVVGPICESGDYIAHDRILPTPRKGTSSAYTTQERTDSPCHRDTIQDRYVQKS